jgi:hypothetical protein
VAAKDLRNAGFMQGCGLLPAPSPELGIPLLLRAIQHCVKFAEENPLLPINYAQTVWDKRERVVRIERLRSIREQSVRFREDGFGQWLLQR